MKQLLKLDKWQVILGLGLLLLYLCLRLINLGIVPIFTDESIYIRWSQIGAQDPEWRFIPLVDGKPPLYHWILMGVLSLNLVPDPLIAGRLISIGAGLVSTILTGVIGADLFRKARIGWLASLLYIIAPMMVVYDRLAVVDSLLTMFGLLSFWLGIRLVRRLRLDTTLLLGMSLGLGLLTKTAALFIALMLPVTGLVGEWPKQWRIKAVVAWFVLMGTAVIMSQVIFNSMRISELFFRIEQKNLEFIIPVSQFIREPFALTWGNLESLLKWQASYLTLPGIFLVGVSFSQRKYWSENLVLIAYYAAPLLAIASFNKVIFPRYLVLVMPFLLLLGAVGLDQILNQLKKLIWQLVVLAVFISLPLFNSWQWITAPAQAHIAQADKDQYYQGQPSGHGVSEMISFLETRARDVEVFLGTDGTFGLTPDAFQIYLYDNPNIEIQGYYPVSNVPEEVVVKAADKETYFVYFNVQDIPPQDNIELISEFEKTSPSNTTYLRLYRVREIE